MAARRVRTTGSTCSELEERFLRELQKDPCNQMQAYERACVALGRPVPKFSKTSAYQTMQRPHVIERLKQLNAAREQRLNKETDDVLREVWAILDTDIVDIIDINTMTITPERLKTLTRQQRKAIKRLELSYDDQGRQVFKVEMWDRPTLIRLAGMHTGAWQRGEQPIIQAEQVNVQNNVQTTYVVAVPEKAPNVEAWIKQATPERKP